jgi:hypothetical protein
MQLGMLINCEFSQFFLNLVVGCMNTLDQLKSLDKEVYINLIFLKNYEGNVKDLMITFSYKYSKLDGSSETI